MTKKQIKQLESAGKNWKNAAEIAAIVTSAIFIPVGRSAPVIWL